MCTLCALACQCAFDVHLMCTCMPMYIFTCVFTPCFVFKSVFLEKKGSESAISPGLILGIAVAIVLVLAVAGELCCCNILISD